MFKQIILLILLSVAAIFFKVQLGEVLHGLLYLHNQLATWLGYIFSTDSVGKLIQAILSLIVIPVVAGAIAALAFWLVKRVAMPHLTGTIWIVWMVLLVTMLAQTSA